MNTTSQSERIFNEGIVAALNKWTALELAVHNEWGGPNSSQKATALCDVVLELFSKRTKVYKDVLIFTENLCICN
jgi:pre-rRNA-processing protein TSR2